MERLSAEKFSGETVLDKDARVEIAELIRSLGKILRPDRRRHYLALLHAGHSRELISTVLGELTELEPRREVAVAETSVRREVLDAESRARHARLDPEGLRELEILKETAETKLARATADFLESIQALSENTGKSPDSNYGVMRTAPPENLPSVAMTVSEWAAKRQVILNYKS